jgi:ferredoxin-thioredoxin reductase catalytic subunit
MDLKKNRIIARSNTAKMVLKIKTHIKKFNGRFIIPKKLMNNKNKNSKKLTCPILYAAENIDLSVLLGVYKENILYKKI